MMSKLQRIILALGLTGLLVPQLTLAQGFAKPGFGKFEVGIPGIKEKTIEEFVNNRETPLIDLVNRIIIIVRGVVIVIGLIVLVVGGYQYMMAGGDASKVSRAKTIMGVALLGIVLAIVGQLILNTISPQFSDELTEPELKFSPTPAP